MQPRHMLHVTRSFQVSYAQFMTHALQRDNVLVTVYSEVNALSGVGVQAGHELFGVGRESIDLTFGGVTIVTAVVATLLGGWALDRVGSSIKNAMLMNGTSLITFSTLARHLWLVLASLN